MGLYALLLTRLIDRIREMIRARQGNMLFDMPVYNLLGQGPDKELSQRLG